MAASTPAHSNGAELPQEVAEGLKFERTQWANGSVYDNPFYTVDEGTAWAAPGTLLKVEKVTDTTKYSLPPATALSRIVYQSRNLNGDLVPVSAYILWPYSPRKAQDGGYQIVAWAHGTSGFYPNTAPSHLKNLWQHYLAPFNLALQGYVVVGSDYAGLGVSRTANGKHIEHEYAGSPAQAHDVLNSVAAARQGFPELSKYFVIAGHSQGGGVAWAAAERQAQEPVDGYLGAVAISPLTRLSAALPPLDVLLSFVVAPVIAEVYPDFEWSDLLTDAGVQLQKLLRKLGGVAATCHALVPTDRPLLKENWQENPQLKDFEQRSAVGGKPIGGPLLVIHGEADPRLSCTVARDTAEATSNRDKEASVEFVSMPGVTHNGAMIGSTQIWLDWVADRFKGVEPKKGFKEGKLETGRPTEAYSVELDWWLAPATKAYQTP